MKPLLVLNIMYGLKIRMSNTGLKKTKNVSIHIRADENLANEFKRVCEQQGYSQSLVMRELIKDYLQKNKQLDLLK